jgi:colanic acid biosynthesis glycosyl transferase WcaI
MSLPRHDVVVCLTTPPFIALVGLFLRWTKGTRCVFWTMDLYPDVPIAVGIMKRGSMAHRTFVFLDRVCLRRADLVVVLGRCMRERVLAKGIDPSHVAMITPWADPVEVPNVPARRLEPAVDTLANLRGSSAGVQPKVAGPNPFRVEWEIGDRFVIEYSGNCGVGHGVSTVCDAMLTLRDDDDIRWVFVGIGVARPRIEEFIERNNIRNVIMRPNQPRSCLGDWISLGDVHLVLVANGFEGLLLPSKFYGAMAAGRPTICIGPDNSEVARVITDEDYGYVVSNGDCAGLVAAIRELQTAPTLALAQGLRGRRGLEARWALEHQCAAWRRHIHRLADIQ